MKSRVNKLFFIAVLLFGSTICSMAQRLFEVKPLDFNTREYDEFAPVIYDNGLVFNTFRKQYIYKTEVDLNEKVINDLYFVPKLDDGNWGPLQFFSNELNTRYHEGKASFSRDGSIIFFTRFESDSAGNVYKAVKSGGEWNSQVLLSLNSEKYRIKDPCISADGKKLYFASMAPGGFGGYDLYVSTFERGDWGKPKNLGSLVNTKGDEVAPFMSNNGKLYFSSNKLPGMGRFDIFYSREINGTWIEPKHLPEPVNSTRDDLYYYSEMGDSIGYFSSNRSRSFDVFSFRSLWPKFEECKTLQKNVYTYIFSEKGSVDNDTTTWLYEWDFGDGNKSRGKKAEVEHTFASTGLYLVQLNVIDTLTGEIMLTEDAYQFEVTDIEQAFISCSDTIIEGTSTKFDASKTYLPEFEKIENYFWDFGDGETAIGPTQEHKYILPGKYTISLLVKSLPDKEGNIKTSCVNKDIIVLFEE